MTDTDIAWLAGLLEGEAYFAAPVGGRSVRPCLRVQLHMTDEDVVRRAATLMGTDKVVQRGPYGELSKQPQWWVVVYGGRAATVMEAVRPYMGARRGSKIDELLSIPNLSHVKETTA